MRILMLNFECPPLGGGAGNATYHQEDPGVFRIWVVPRGNGCRPPLAQRLAAAMGRLFDRPRVYVEIVAAIPREHSGKFQAFKRSPVCDEVFARRSKECQRDL